MHRLFVALRPPPATRERMLAIMGGVPGARWQDDEQLHLTLAFIGEVERPIAEEIAVALARVRGRRLTLRAEGIGTFDRRGRPDTLWTKVPPTPALSGLHRAIARAIAGAGDASEKRVFHPHVTIARLGRQVGTVEPFLTRHAGFATEPFDCDAFLLFESRLGSGGASYTAIARYSLD